jgi:hypothetical protein
MGGKGHITHQASHCRAQRVPAMGKWGAVDTKPPKGELTWWRHEAENDIIRVNSASVRHSHLVRHERGSRCHHIARRELAPSPGDVREGRVFAFACVRQRKKKLQTHLPMTSYSGGRGGGRSTCDAMEDWGAQRTLRSLRGDRERARGRCCWPWTSCCT